MSIWTLLFLFILVFGVIVFFILKRNSYKNVNITEEMVSRQLEELPEEYQIFENLLFKNKDRSVQIDHLVVSPYGIFVIETKGINGWVFGSVDGQYWTQMLCGEKYTFYNPILQNNGHIRFLRFILKDVGVCKFIPIVVFNDTTELKLNTKEYIVINCYQLNDVILRFNTRVYSEEQCKKISETIEQAIVDIDDEEAFVQHLYYAQRRKQEAERAEVNGICPRCGGHLVRRYGQYGIFYGCSNFPKCRYRR